MRELTKSQARVKRHRRLRVKVGGTPICPRLVVYRSLKHIHAQLINDAAGRTLASTSTARLKLTGTVVHAAQVGEAIAKLAKEIGVKRVVFDRGGYKYHGQVKAVAEGARAGGLKF